MGRRATDANNGRQCLTERWLNDPNGRANWLWNQCNHYNKYIQAISQISITITTKTTNTTVQNEPDTTRNISSLT